MVRMAVTIENLPQARVRCIVVVAADRRAAAEEQALKRLGQQVNLKGFRAGKAPAAIIREQVKPEQLLEETIRALAPELITAAMNEHGLKPIIAPKISLTVRDPLTVEILFVERPPVKLKKPYSLKLEPSKPRTATPKEIDDLINNVLSQDRIETPVERAAQKGDLVRMQLKATDKAGTPVTELNDLPYSTTVGSEDLIPGLDNALLGIKKGESKTIEATFPTDHGIAGLRGKTAKITVTATTIASVQLPELTAEFLKTRLGMESSPEDFRKGVEKTLNQQHTMRAAKDREEAFFELIRSATTVDLAPELLDAEVQQMLGDLQANLEREKLSFEDWLKRTGKQPKDILDEMKKIAGGRITLRLGLQEFIKHKNIVIDEAQMKTALAEARTLAENDGRTISDDDIKPDGELHSQVEWEQQVRKVLAEAIG